MALRNFTLLYLRACQNHTKKTWIFQAPEAPAPAAPAMRELLFCWMRKDGKRRRRRQCRRYLAYIFFVVTYVCSARLFCVWAPPSCVLLNFSSSRHVSKSANLIGRIVFDAARQTKKTNPRRFKKNDAFTRGIFRVGVHTHIGALCLVTRR